ncbi:MAG: four-carbon acid sugar kinase family protein [Betaproteobacteria bacterium]|nr:four-carbon acid sugar kinase family protein [Betaproteobacteria bacterium]
MLLGCIADDFTGATDLASMLVRAGMRTVQTIGVPSRPLGEAPDAVVVALKSRTIPARDAVAQSLAALAWLRGQGAKQFYFKYCSTFDSTDAGNIGPVADALLDALGAKLTIACPAFPTNKRTIYLGHLFVGDVLLSDSPMRDHPLTPMRDANLVRVLGRQTRRKVALVPHEAVAKGADAIRAAFAKLEADGVAHAVVDAIDDADLMAIGSACRDLALVTAGSGVALGLPQNFRAAGLLPARTDAAALPDVKGASAVLSGSCSAQTRKQVAAMARTHTAVALDPLAAASAEAMADAALAQAAGDLAAQRPFLVYSTAEPAQVAKVQSALGRERAAELIEQAFGVLAARLVERGVRRLVVAGGETAGAVVQALGVESLAIGPAIDPGVPWTTARGRTTLALALKSGNFGSDDFFLKSLAMLP